MPVPVAGPRWPFDAAFALEALALAPALSLERNTMMLAPPAYEAEVGENLDRVLARIAPALRRGKTTLSCLMPGCRTRGLHIDTGQAAYDDGACSFRYHLPLLSNDGAVFNIDGTEYRMPVGWIYLVNPLIPHAVINRGDRPRVHLFFNAITRED
jgi:hypothetical protein